MYATVMWSIDPNATSSADIKAAIEKAFGKLKNTPLRASIRIARMRSADDLSALADRLEDIHTEFPTEFDYVCVGSAGGTALAPSSRPTWDQAAVDAIIA